MSQFGAHAFIWSADWTAAGAERVIASAAACGLDFVEIPVLDPRSFDVSATRALLDEHGIGCRCSLGLPEQFHMPFAPAEAEAFLEEAVDVAAALGSPLLTGVLYGHLGTLTRKPPTAAEHATIAATLARVARYAAARDLELGIEAVNRYETYLVNRSIDAVRLVEQIAEPNVLVHLDTYHMNIEEKGFREPILAARQRLGYMHLSESDRGTPGTGNVHWDDAFAALAEVGYTGDFVMESFVAVNEAVIGATAIWRDVVGDPEALVRDGLSFLRERASAHGLAPS
jgi:D-psicose/D-tagatose/L-ribulose 3-epimerase